MELAVLMTCFNEEIYIREAIDSVLAQDFVKFKFYIIDDCSTDNTSSIISSYKDQRIRYIRLDKNIGQTAALNYGVRLIEEPYIIRMDADDISTQNRFSKMFSKLKKENLDILGSSCYEFSGELELRKIIKAVGKENINRLFFIGTPFVHGSLILKKSIFDRLGFYNESYSICADLDLYYRIYLDDEISFDNSQEIYYGIRRHSNQLTRNNRAVIETLAIKFFMLGKLFKIKEYRNFSRLILQIIYFSILLIRNICIKKVF